MLDEVVEEITKQQSGNIIAYAYLNMFSLLVTKDKIYFDHLKEILFVKQGQWRRRHATDILQSLINYTIWRGNKGDPSAPKENLELYELGLKKGLFLDGGLMDDLVYTNIAITALKIGSFDWCEGFLKENKTYLAEKIRQDAYSLGWAFLLFYKNKNTEAIDFLNDMSFTDDLYYVRGNSVLLRIYFIEHLNDGDYFDILWSKADAFEKYLRQNKNLSEDKLKRFLNFTVFLKRLIKTGIGKPALKKIESDVASASEVFEKPWLLKQIDVLKKRGA